MMSMGKGAISCGHRDRQRGAALIITLIFLAMMTTISVTTLTSTRMGQDMAANYQESNRAFQAAETGIVVSLLDTSWSTAGVTEGSGQTGLGYYEYEREFQNFSPMRRRKSNAFSAVHFQSAQFAVSSRSVVKASADADPIAKAEIGEGVYVVVPKL